MDIKFTLHSYNIDNSLRQPDCMLCHKKVVTSGYMVYMNDQPSGQFFCVECAKHTNYKLTPSSATSIIHVK